MKNTRHCFLSMFLTSALACAAAATAEPRTAPAGLGEPPRLRIESCPADLKAGLDAIKAEFPHRFGAVQEPGLRLIRFETLAAGATYSLTVEKQGLNATVRYARQIDAFRALGRLLGETGGLADPPFRERARFQSLGITLDCSRNAVFTPAEMKSRLCRRALMGINTVVPYTEDTYIVPGEPFWGYLRGGYSFDELKSLDDFAFNLGIEMFLCVQTLGHMSQVLQWPAYANVRDTEHVLIAEGDPTYALIEKTLRAASAPFRSKRIHVGMDEAHGLGTGGYRQRYGEKTPFRIFSDHLDRVRAICAKLGLKPMIWSDMYFRLGSKTGSYYDRKTVIPPEAVALIPKDVEICYWDYYHLDPAFYGEWIDRHRQIGIEPVVVGGAWSWMRFWTALPYTFCVTDALMTASKQKQIRDVFFSTWFDDGAECELHSVLPAIQRFAEHGYNDAIDESLLRANFFGSTNVSYDDWLQACEIDAAPGLAKPEEGAINIAKPLLWQDPLLSVFDPQLEGISLSEHYRALADELSRAATRTPNSDRLRFPALIAGALQYKCDLRRNLAEAYAKGDRERLRALADGDLKNLQKAVNELWRYHRGQWLKTRKPFGWEVIEHRYGALMARLDTVSARLEAYLDGSVASIPELEVKLEKLYDSLYDGKATHMNYSRIATPSFNK